MSEIALCYIIFILNIYSKIYIVLRVDKLLIYNTKDKAIMALKQYYILRQEIQWNNEL